MRARVCLCVCVGACARAHAGVCSRAAVVLPRKRGPGERSAWRLLHFLLISLITAPLPTPLMKAGTCPSTGLGAHTADAIDAISYAPVPLSSIARSLTGHSCSHHLISSSPPQPSISALLISPRAQSDLRLCARLQLWAS